MLQGIPPTASALGSALNIIVRFRPEQHSPCRLLACAFSGTLLTDGKAAAAFAFASSAVVLKDGESAEAFARTAFAVILAEAASVPSFSVPPSGTLKLLGYF